MTSVGRRCATAMASAARDPRPADVDALGGQLGVDGRGAVRPLRLAVDRLDLRRQCHISCKSWDSA